jgi:hypothetical protein
MKNYEGRDSMLRLKSVILHDKTVADTSFLNVLKSDLARLLSNYLELADKPTVKLEVDEQGVYQLRVKASAEKVKSVSVLK